MNGCELLLEDFCLWLCEREQQIVGCPGAWFNDPLAEWISGVMGRVYGVDGNRYGPASYDICCWSWLPAWAQKFVSWTERYSYNKPLTGEEAFLVLADIEKRYRGAGWLFHRA